MIDFASVTYHSMLTTDQEERLENLQERVIKIIYGYNVSYNEILSIKLIPSLKERRGKMFAKFALKSTTNTKVSTCWLPEKVHTEHNTRHALKYEEKHSRTQRLYNSPLYLMRRTLNKLHGAHRRND